MLTKLSFRYIWIKKSRSLIVVIAAGLAAFLFCSILLISIGLVKTIQADAKHRYGDYTVCMAYGDEKDQKDFLLQCADSEIVTKNLEGFIDRKGLLFSVWSVSENWYSSFDCDLTEGRYPNKPNEILIPDSVSDQEEIRVGSTIQADLFVRKGEDDLFLDDRYSISYAGTRQTIKSVDYLIVGCYSDDSRSSVSGINMPCLYIIQEPDQSGYTYIYSKIVQPLLWNELVERNPMTVFINREYLSTLGYSGSGESVLGSIALLCTALIVLVAAAVIILIGDAFALSYREQVHEIGVLSSVGATAFQIKALFALESILLSFSGMVFGVALSIGCAFLCISRIAPYILSVCYVTADFIMPSPLLPIALSVVLTLIISLISALIPIAVSKHSSQIDLVRDSSTIQMKKRFQTVRMNKTEYVLAERYRLSNLQRFWLMVLSLGVTMCILLLSVGVCNAEIIANEKLLASIPYDISVSFSASDARSAQSLVNSLFDEKTIDCDRSYWYLSYSGETPSAFSEIVEKKANVIGIPEKMFQAIMKGQSAPDLYAAQNTVRFSIEGDNVRQENESLFSSPSIRIIQGNINEKITVGCIPWDDLCELFPCFRDVDESVLLFPMNSDLLMNWSVHSGNAFIFAENHKEISELFSADDRLNVFDLAADYEQQKTDAVIIRVFLTFFLTIIFAVCFINMFFTLFSNIKLREKDYLILQTLGMDSRQTRKMVFYECSISCLVSLAIGCLGSFLFAVLINNLGGLSYSVPWFVMIIVIALTVLSHFIAFAVADKNICKINMIEGIRNY